MDFRKIRTPPPGYSAFSSLKPLFHGTLPCVVLTSNHSDPIDFDLCLCNLTNIPNAQLHASCLLIGVHSDALVDNSATANQSDLWKIRLLSILSCCQDILLLYCLYIRIRTGFVPFHLESTQQTVPLLRLLCGIQQIYPPVALYKSAFYHPDEATVYHPASMRLLCISDIR